MSARPPDAAGWVHAFAPAKVNPWLEVLGPRPDGYHELVTLLLALELGDGVAVRRGERPGVALRVVGPYASSDVPRDGENLAARAAAAALERLVELGALAPDEAGVEVELEKRVPSQAGLGGGSSDAAATLVAVEACFGRDLGDAWRRARLASFGSDCVFFENASTTGAALCKGRGEDVVALAAPSVEWTVALVTPSARCATAAVYGALGFPLSDPRALPTVPGALFAARPAEARAWLFNRLEGAALAMHPELAQWRGALDAAGAGHFRLAGSGASFFGLFDTRGEAESALEGIAVEARRWGLATRGSWVTRPARCGARLSPRVV